jgi:hypothetical protein
MPPLSLALAIQVPGSLRWDRSIQVPINRLLDLCNLGGSSWIGLHTDCGYGDEATAMFRLDPFCNSSVSTPTSIVSDWPLLFIRFKCVSTIRLSGFRDVGGYSREVGNVRVENVSGEEAITEFTDDYGASLSLQHFPLVDALVLSPYGEVLELPVDSI